jgi:hypothetical protein
MQFRMYRFASTLESAPPIHDVYARAAENLQPVTETLHFLPRTRAAVVHA